MSATLLIKDETATGKTLSETILQFETEEITVEELIEARVTAEVERYNTRADQYFNGLVQPQEAEITLRGYLTKGGKKIDPEKQVYIALDAFQKNGFFVLVDNQQVDRLDQKIQIRPDSSVSFVRLVPLVGG